MLDVELLRYAEIGLAERGEADLGSDARDAKLLDRLVVLILADHVPRAVLREQGVRVDRSLALLVAGDRPVTEKNGALLRDRAFEFPEPALELWRIVGIARLARQ